MNRTKVLNGCASALLAGVAMSGLTPTAVAAEDATVRAFAMWRGDGQVVETGPGELTFAGTLSGDVFVDREQGPLPAGQLMCLAMLQVRTADGVETGSGRCTFSIPDGSKAYAKVSCSGVHLIGCRGDFTFDRGTGKFEGITGGGPVMIRAEFANSGAEEETNRRAGSGVIFWPALHYTLP